MSRYPPPDYRGPRERSRSPPRFPPDRRPSAASVFDNRPAGPPRNASEVLRGPTRPPFDGPRVSLSGVPGSGPLPRPPYSSLREAPPLGSGDRGRPFRERDWRERPSSPRSERSPLRAFKDPRDYPPRDLDINRARRDSRDGPPPAGPTYSEAAAFPPAPSRGGYPRGRGRGDFGLRGGRGGRRDFEDRERDLFRRERSPPPAGWGRDLSRDSREPERRDEWRFDRRDEDRRPEWTERQREGDRARRDLPPQRLEARLSRDSSASRLPALPVTQAPLIDPGRLALIESTGADPLSRKSSFAQIAQPPPVRRDIPEAAAYLNGRAETTAHRYSQRGSSPLTQAPPVPAFGSLPLQAAPPVTASSNVVAPSFVKPLQEPKAVSLNNEDITMIDRPSPAIAERSGASAGAPTAPRTAPSAPKAQLTSAPPTAPRAPRALEVETPATLGNRLQGVRSLESLARTGAAPIALARNEGSARPSPLGQVPTSPRGPPPAPPSIALPESPGLRAHARVGDLAAPTGPRATRVSPAQASISPRPSFASPSLNNVVLPQSLGNLARGQTPPSFAPSGPRNRSFSVSPKVTSSIVPTAPKAVRGPPLAPRGLDRGAPPGPAQDRAAAQPPWAPPAAPRSLQWNQWRRPGVPPFGEKSGAVKRDFMGEEKDSTPQSAGRSDVAWQRTASTRPPMRPNTREFPSVSTTSRNDSRMDIDSAKLHSSASGHSARQSFFGMPAEPVEDDEDEPEASDAIDELMSSSDDDEVDAQQELALLNAKFERNKRTLESQLVDLSTRPYRATTPLEYIARLARISSKDLERVRQNREMDVDPSLIRATHPLPATHSSESDEGPDIRTPKGLNDDRVAIQPMEEGLERVHRHIKRPSPEVVSLPYLMKDQMGDAIAKLDDHREEVEAAVFDALDEELDLEDSSEQDKGEEFAELFRRWREECEDLDRQREEQERLERALSQEPGPELDAPAGQPLNSLLEGRRLHKFNTEYEIEQVLRQSEETARLEQEKLNREARKNQADLEKEANLPDQETKSTFERGVFIDTNRHRDPELLTQVFSYEPPTDNFTEDEQQLFVAAFKETPKKWGEIASLLPGRTYKDCIQHYYANKWDGRFRDNRTKKLKAGGRRGRGAKAPLRGRGSAAMADLGRSEELGAAGGIGETGRPKRAAAPTTFGEREVDAKAALVGPSPAKKAGNGDIGPDKPVKRRKGMGDKPGRKSKANLPLATLAAAPNMSPNKLLSLGFHTKDDVAMAQSLEDAGLLAAFQASHNGAPSGESHSVYLHEGFVPQAVASEEARRPKAVGQSHLSKSSASSYWSVPEQTDFAKYIAHFGTDFAAIAAHMGTKTQTMIKNHYQRQIDNGNRPDLRGAAEEADRRRAKGEDMGVPPTPTPIVKRKYDNPQPAAPRPLAPHIDAMEIDDPAPRPAAAIHASPPQFQVQPRFTTSAQATPIPAQRSPVLPAAASDLHQTSTTIPRALQHPPGSRFSTLPETRPESRLGPTASSSFRASQEVQTRGPPVQQGRSVPDATDPVYIRKLREMQERAMLVQDARSQQDRLDQLQRQSVFHRESAHGSPANPPLPEPVERQPRMEQRAQTPPRLPFQSSTFAKSVAGQSIFGQTSPFSTAFGGRQPTYPPSPPRKHEPRLHAVPTTTTAPSVVAAPPSFEPPKRSNLLSILNDEPEEPKSSKRESLGSQRALSPRPSNFSNAPPPTSLPAMPLRRETFGQPTMPQSQFSRSSFAQPRQNPASQATSLKQEPPSVGVSQPPMQPDWAHHVLGQQASVSEPSPPKFERDVRPYWSHRASALGPLNSTARANPSPPPHTIVGHSRTPSLTTGPTQPPRDQQHPVAGQQSQHALHQRGLTNPFTQHTNNAPFNHAAAAPGHHHAHHSHNSSIGGSVLGMQQRALSREDSLRQHEHAVLAQREREEQERRWRQDTVEIERREAQFAAQRLQDQDRIQQAFGRVHAPQQALRPPALGGPSFMPLARPGSLREQSLRDAEKAMLEEEHRQQIQDSQRRRQQEAMMIREREEELRRRQHEEMFRRQTPSGSGGYRPPPRAR